MEKYSKLPILTSWKQQEIVYKFQSILILNQSIMLEIRITEKIHKIFFTFLFI